MKIEEILKLRLDKINEQIEIYKQNAIQEIKNEEMIPATSDVALLRDLKEQQLLIKQTLKASKESENK